MKTYRHLNLLIDGKLFESLRKYSQRQEIPVSAIVREAVTEFLDVRQGRQAAQTQMKQEG